ncbi:MAG: translocation/assembly module TamB domain-containing protein [bacterium]
MGKLHIDIWGRVVISDVRFGQADEPILTAKKIVVSISVPRLIANRTNPGNVVKKATIIDPDIKIIRSPDGVFNYSPLIKKSAGGGGKIPGFPIYLKNGRALYEDRYEKAPYPIRRVLLKHFNGSVKLREERLLLISLDSADTNIASRAHLDFKYDLRAGWKLDSEFERLPLSTLDPFFKRNQYKFSGIAPKLKFYAEGAFTKKGHPPKYSWGGETHFEKAAFNSSDGLIRLTEAKGFAQFSDKNVLLEGVEANFCGGSIQGYGSISNYSKPVFSARISFDSVSPGEAARIFYKGDVRLPAGRLNGSAIIAGGLDSPRAIIWIAGGSFSYRGLNSGRAQGQLLYADNGIEFSLETAGEKQKLNAKGSLKLASGNRDASYSFAADFKDFDLKPLLAAGDVKLKENVSGVVSGSAVFRDNGPNEKPIIFGAAHGENIAVKGLKNAVADAGFRYEEGNFIIENFAAEAGSEMLLADGIIYADGKLDIKIGAAVGKISTALAFMDKKEIKSRGSLRVSGSVGGTLKKPEFAGKAEGENIAVSAMASTRVAGNIKYKDEILTISDLSARTGADNSRVDGWLDFHKKEMYLDARLSNTPISGIAGLLKDTLKFSFKLPEDLTGVIDAQAIVSGKFDAPSAKITASTGKVIMYGESIASSKFVMVYDKYLTIGEGKISAFGGVIRVSGALDPDKMNLVFEGKGMKSEMLARAAKLKITGAIDIAGTVEGTFKSPLSSVAFSSEKMSFRGTDFKVNPGTIELRDEKFRMNDLKIARGGENYMVTASYDLASSAFDISIALKNADLATIAGFLPYKFPEGTSGPLNGQFRMFSVADQTNGGAQITGHDLKIGKYPIDNLTFEGRLDGSQLKVTSFEATNKQSLVQASGMVDLSQKASSKLNVSASGIELSRLQEMGLISLPLQGLADVNVDLISEGGGQKMLGSVTAYNPTVAQVGFDRAQGRFEFDGNMFTVINLQLVRGKDRLTISADLPMRKEFDNRFKVIAKSQNLDASILNHMLANFGGSVSGKIAIDNVQVAGSMKAPVFTGTISLDSATFTQKDMKPAITGIKSLMHFSGNSLVIASLVGNIGDKQLKLQGSVAFNKLVPETLELNAQDAGDVYMEYKNIYRGHFDIKDLGVRLTKEALEITAPDKKRQPIVNIHDGVFTLPAATVGVAAPPKFNINFGARNLSIHVGEKFTVQNGWKGMSIEPSGEVQISGSLSKPQVKGWLTSRRGYINFYTTTFNIIDETIIGFYTLEDIGVVPIFSTSARSRVSGIDITMYASGPMLDINQYPVYRELCGTNDTGDSLLGANASAGLSGGVGGAPTMALGPNGETLVSVCPRVRFEAYAENDPAGQALSTQAVLQKLTFMDTLNEGGDLASALQNGAINVFSPYFGVKIGQRVNLDNFSINLDPNKDVLIKLEKQITNRLSVRYERLFSQTIEEDLEVRYEFRKRSFLKWGIDQDSQTEYQVEYRIRY